jgi:H+/Cl- antiporter ClcA
LLAGGAAGIAAAFNAPLAGIVFAIEELSGSFEKGVSGTIITTVVLCGIVAQSIMGNYSYFGSSNASLNVIHGGSLPIIVVSVVAGGLGGLFSLMLIQLSGLMKKVFKTNPLWVVGLLGLAVALIGFLSNGMTYGSGYDAAKDIITNNIGLNQNLNVYGPLKMLATLLTYLSGIPGGIFAPSLSAGAGIGQIISYWFDPRLHDAVVLLCTVAYFSGVVQSPITAFVIVLEMTDSTTSNMVLPIMLCSLIATAVSKAICREPLYNALSQRYLAMFKTEKPATDIEEDD